MNVDLPKLFALLLDGLANCTPEETVEDITNYRAALLELRERTSRWIDNLDEMLAEIEEAGGFEEWRSAPITVRLSLPENE